MNLKFSSVTTGRVKHHLFYTIQAMFEEAGELPRDLETMNEKTEYLASVYFTEDMSQQVSDLRRQTEDLQQAIKQRLQNIQDAAKVCGKRSIYTSSVECIRKAQC